MHQVHSSRTRRTVRNSARALANRELLAHARWQVALSRELQREYLAQASPLLQLAFPHLALLFGRRACRGEQWRRHAIHLRRRFA